MPVGVCSRRRRRQGTDIHARRDLAIERIEPSTCPILVDPQDLSYARIEQRSHGRQATRARTSNGSIVVRWHDRRYSSVYPSYPDQIWNATKMQSKEDNHDRRSERQSKRVIDEMMSLLFSFVVTLSVDAARQANQRRPILTAGEHSRKQRRPGSLDGR